MGYDTDYLGYLAVTPPLNRAEVEWMSGFADWCALPDGEVFRLPMNPRAALAEAFAAGGGSMLGPRNVPYGVRDWRFSDDGRRLSWRRACKSNDAEWTIAFLVDTFIGPRAEAAGVDSPDFASFTFDHRLDGVLVGERYDTDELFVLEVRASTITRQTIVPGIEWWHDG